MALRRELLALHGCSQHLRLQWCWSGGGSLGLSVLCLPGFLRPPLTEDPRLAQSAPFLHILSGRPPQPPPFLQTDSSCNQVSLPLLRACSAEPDQLPLMAFHLALSVMLGCGGGELRKALTRGRLSIPSSRPLQESKSLFCHKSWLPSPTSVHLRHS